MCLSPSSNSSRAFSFIVLFVILIARSNQCDAAARTFKVPLVRATTQGVGIVGQPVMSYYTSVSIGTPPKVFNVQFDVGLDDFWIPHYMWSPFKINLHYGKGFKCKDSTSCAKTDRNIEFIYQQTKLTGKPYEDILSFNDAQVAGTLTAINGTQSNDSSTATPISITLRKNFLAVSDASDARFKDLPVDGFIGLSPDPRAASSIDNLLNGLHNSGLIDNLQFSLWLNPLLDDVHGGELILGGVDQMRYQGQVYWHQLMLASNQWSLGLQFVSLGNQIVGCNGQKCQAVLSSGLNEVYGPRAEVERIYHLLNTSHQSTGLETIDCKRIPSLPILTFSIDGVPYALLPTNYVRKIVDGFVFKKETCYVAILPSPDSSPNKPKWVLGTNFLGAYYSIYDMTYRQVGFASMR